jgi:hypothetical protein
LFVFTKCCWTFISCQVRLLFAKTIEVFLVKFSLATVHTKKYSLSKTWHDQLWNKTPGWQGKIVNYLPYTQANKASQGKITHLYEALRCACMRGPSQWYSMDKETQSFRCHCQNLNWKTLNEGILMTMLSSLSAQQQTKDLHALCTTPGFQISRCGSLQFGPIEVFLIIKSCQVTCSNSNKFIQLIKHDKFSSQ